MSPQQQKENPEAHYTVFGFFSTFLVILVMLDHATKSGPWEFCYTVAVLAGAVPIFFTTLSYMEEGELFRDVWKGATIGSLILVVLFGLLLGHSNFYFWCEVGIGLLLCAVIYWIPYQTLIFVVSTVIFAGSLAYVPFVGFFLYFIYKAGANNLAIFSQPYEIEKTPEEKLEHDVKMLELEKKVLELKDQITSLQAPSKSQEDLEIEKLRKEYEIEKLKYSIQHVKNKQSNP